MFSFGKNFLRFYVLFYVCYFEKKDNKAFIYQKNYQEILY